MGLVKKRAACLNSSVADFGPAKSGSRPAHPRSGRYLKQPTGYWSFEPVGLPVDPPIDVGVLEPTLSRAALAVGRLDGVSELVPNPDVFVAMYVRKEAVLSSRIEGTQASLSDVLAYESGLRSEAPARFSDVREVYNYVEALNHGLERLPDLPLSLRLLREVHAKLLEGVRGGEKAPGAFRRTQNWIGAPGCSLDEAVFVPPPAASLLDHLSGLERYIRGTDKAVTLVRCGVAHAQFETIHPFLDGNGRLGRLLVSLMLHERGVLERPLLYLSAYFTARKTEYYDWLMRVRERGDWEGWLCFFLEGVREVATEAFATAKKVLELQRDHRALVERASGRGANALRLLDQLALYPVINVKRVADLLEISIPTANSLVARFESLGFLQEITGKQRDRVFRYEPYLELLRGDE